MKTCLHLIFCGLFSDPSGDCCGMRETADRIKEQHPDADHAISSYSWNGSSPNETADATCRQVLDRIRQCQPDFIFIHAHSFGGSLLAFFTQWLAKWHSGEVVIDAAFSYDPCHEPWHFGPLGWYLAQPPVKMWHSWFQRKGRPAGVSGGGYSDPNGGGNTDCSGWVGPEVAHISYGPYRGIPSDSRVRQAVYEIVQTIIGAVKT